MAQTGKLKKRARGYIAGRFDVDETFLKLTVLSGPLLKVDVMIDRDAFWGNIEKM